MLKLEAIKDGPYMRLTVQDFYGIKIMSDLLDEKEAVDMAVQLIETAENLLPALYTKEEIALIEVREKLEK